MRRLIKNIISVFCAIAILLCTASCGGGGNEVQSSGSSGGAAVIGGGKASSDSTGTQIPVNSQQTGTQTSGSSKPSNSTVTTIITKPSSSKAPVSSKTTSSEEEDDSPRPVMINGKPWLLTFEDEFNGDELDYFKWNPTPLWIRGEGGDFQWGLDENIKVKDGKLHLTLSGKEKPYGAGAIRTSNTFMQVYGYYEVRCKLPTYAGINASFWLMCAGAGSYEQLGGKDGTEIDIFESHSFNTGEIQHALHWDGYEEKHQTTEKVLQIPGIYEGWHTFALEWNEDQYIFYVDGKRTWTTSAGGVCQVPVYLKLTVATGDWVGDVNPAVLPTDGMVVDYVRVYKAAR